MTGASFPSWEQTMPDSDSAPGLSTSLSLLADDGIVNVTFAAILTSDQYAELLEVTQRASTSVSLIQELQALGRTWTIKATARRARPKRDAGHRPV